MRTIPLHQLEKAKADSGFLRSLIQSPGPDLGNVGSILGSVTSMDGSRAFPGFFEE